MYLEPVTPSVLMTVQTVTNLTGCGLLHSVILNPGSAASVINIYDNTAGSGTQLALLQGVANGDSIVFTPIRPIYCGKGITSVVTGTAATAQVYFTKIS